MRVFSPTYRNAHRASAPWCMQIACFHSMHSTSPPQPRRSARSSRSADTSTKPSQASVEQSGFKRPREADLNQRSRLRNHTTTQDYISQHAVADSPAAPRASIAATYSAPQLPGAAARWRLELFAKTDMELSAAVAFCISHGISRINLPNKNTKDDLLSSLHAIRRQPGGEQLDVCAHYSLKNQYNMTVACSYQKLQHFCSAVQNLAPAAAQEHQPSMLTGTLPGASASANSVLLISGGGQKKKLETVLALQMLAGHAGTNTSHVSPPVSHSKTISQSKSVMHSLAAPQPRSTAAPAGAHPILQQSQQASLPVRSRRLPVLAVAFNPYLPGVTEQQEEQARLEAKLRTGLVTQVYIQIGSDVVKLEDGLHFVKDAVNRHAASEVFYASTSTEGDECGSQQSDLEAGSALSAFGISSSCRTPGVQRAERKTIAIFGSILVPSRKLLAQMAFRPWSGVHLSAEYLSDVSTADTITRQVLQVYARFGVVPLVESAVKTEAALQHVVSVLMHGYAETSPRSLGVPTP